MPPRDIASGPIDRIARIAGGNTPREVELVHDTVVYIYKNIDQDSILYSVMGCISFAFLYCYKVFIEEIVGLRLIKNSKKRTSKAPLGMDRVIFPFSRDSVLSLSVISSCDS